MNIKYLFYFLVAIMLLESCSKEDSTGTLTIRLNRTRLELAKGTTKQLVATIPPQIDEKIIWNSSVPNVAIVDSTGLVTAIEEGETVISATVKGLIANCELTVMNVAVDSIVLYKQELGLSPGDSYQMKATIVPSAALQDVEWSSDNEQVVTVDENGVITAIALGEAKVYAKAGGKEAYCLVSVSNNVATLDELKEVFSKAEGGASVSITLTNDIEITEEIVVAQENGLAREFIIDGGGVYSLKWQSESIMFRVGKNQSLTFNNVILDGNSLSVWNYFLYAQGGTITLGEGTIVKNLMGYAICTFSTVTDEDTGEEILGTLVVDGASITENFFVTEGIYMFQNDGRLILKGGNISNNGSGYITINKNPKNPTGEIYIANALPEGSCFELKLWGPRDGDVIVSGWDGYVITESDLQKIVLKYIGYNPVSTQELYLEDGVIKIRIP